MPSTYNPPDVIVTEQRLSNNPTPTPPQLSTVVVGPATQIVVRANAGEYVAGVALTLPFPTLIPGAVVNVGSASFVLDAQDANGIDIGLFNLNVPDDVDIASDYSTFTVEAYLALEYSILSYTNNNQVDNVKDQTYGNGIPDGIFFTDENIDFLGRGATIGGDSFVTILQPPSMAGKYEIFGMVPNGNVVNEVMVQVVDPATNDPILAKTANILNSALPSGSTIYGFPATHELGGSNTSNITSGTVSTGIGVEKSLADITVSAHITAIFEPGNISIPSSGSGDAVVFAPLAGSGSGVTGTGKNNSDWQSFVAAATVGNWVRFALTTPVLRDFEVVGVDEINFTLTLQNPDNGSTGSTSLDGTTITYIELFKVLNQLDAATGAAGDYVTGTALSGNFQIELLTVRPGFIILNAADPTFSSSTPTPLIFYRGIPYRGAAATYDLIKHVTTGFTGSVLVSYEAARLDLPLNGLIEIGSQEDIINNIGVISPDNVLALMCDMVTRSGLTDGSNIFYALATPDNTLASHQAALDVLSSNDVYFIVPATQDPDIISLYYAHVLEQSMPLNKHERVLLASTAITTTEEVIPETTSDPYPTGYVNYLNTVEFESENINWNEVSPGNVLKIMSTSSQTTGVLLASYRILSVDATDGNCTLLTPVASQYVGVVDAPIYLNVRIDTYPFTKDQQSQDWANYAASIHSNRVMIIRPDVINLTYTDETTEVAQDIDIVAPMYYGCAVYAGMASAYAPQQPMTNVPIPGINRLYNSNAYFTVDQLNVIAQGGNNIFIQANANALPTSRHQLMTDMTAIETREFSIIKLVDYTAKYFRSSYRPYIGNRNITQEFLTQMRGVGEAIINGLVASGVLLQGTQIISVVQDPDEPDAINIVVALVIPYPCNYIYITLQF